MSLASRQIWNWRDDTPERRCALQTARLRRHGLVQGLVVLAVGSVFNLVLGQVLLGRVLVIVGAIQTLVALGRPLWLERPRRLLAGFGLVVGRALAWLLLTPLWLLVFVPAAAWLRLRGHDPLHRAPLDAGLTAWIPRRRQPTAAAAERQFLDEDREARSLRRPVGTLPTGTGGPPA